MTDPTKNDETNEPIKHTDPIDGRILAVRSIYRPARTLLEGATYHRGPSILQPKQPENKEQMWRRANGEEVINVSST